MKAKMPGLLCRSHASIAVCRSHASTAACIPTDLRHAMTPAGIMRRHQYQDRTIVKYSRLTDSRHFTINGSTDRSVRAVTLPMVMTKQRERAPPKKHATTNSNPPLLVDVPTTPCSANDNQLFQVVVMKVSIHCQGCAGKVRKHISKMEGVTSFSIDLEAKRVTVMGHVSPVGVLESISKVKRAEFWSC